MESFEGRVAVITGGASGIGLATAERLAAAGMKIVLADVEAGRLETAVAGLEAAGADAIAVPTDVAKASAVEALAKATLDHFGAVHVLFNNAGVALSGASWENSLEDWEWVLGVNLWGVVHGVRTFVPILLEQGGEGHIVNTASMAGMISNPGMSVYNVTKFSVVTLTETLYLELKAMSSPVSASVVCPGFIRTRIMDSERNRPGDRSKDPETPDPSPLAAAIEHALRTGIASGYEAKAVAEAVFEGIRDDRFYILPAQDEIKAAMRQRFENIAAGKNPPLPNVM